MDIGEADIATREAVGECFVVHAEEVEDGGPEVVDRADIGDGMVAEFIGGSVHVAWADAAAGEPEAEAEGIVVASVASLAEGSAAEFAAEDDEGFVEEAA